VRFSGLKPPRCSHDMKVSNARESPALDRVANTLEDYDGDFSPVGTHELKIGLATVEIYPSR
jgi:hypothetical protein